MSDLIDQAEALCDLSYRGGQTIRVRDQIYAKRYIQMCDLMPQLVAEIKRLREDNAKALELYLVEQACRLDLTRRFEELVETRSGRREREFEELEEQLAAWQKIAIDLKAISYFVNFRSREEVFDLQPIDIQEAYRTRAAKDLGVQVTQEAGYTERLEKAFLAVLSEDENRKDCNCTVCKRMRQDAQVALEKIREGAGDDR